MLELPVVQLGADKKCPLAKLSYHRRGVFHAGRWMITPSLGLTSFVWDGERWKLLGESTLFGGSRVWEISGLASTPAGLRAIGNRGEVFGWEGDNWVAIHGVDAVFKKTIESSLVSWDDARQRIVVWGGRTPNGHRPYHTTVVYEPAKDVWRQLKITGKSERDVALEKRWVFTRPVMTYDAKLRAIVRVGYQDSFVLDGDVWKPCAASYEQCVADPVAPKNFVRGIAHDQECGVTLVVDFARRRVIAFAPDACAVVASFVIPTLTLPDGVDEARSHHAFDDTWAYCPETRCMHFQNRCDGTQHFTIELTPAFTASG